MSDPNANSELRSAAQVAAPPPVVQVRNVDRWFGDVQALTNLNIEVPAGKITVLLGPNGAGKTTAIRIITGALATDAGSSEVFGLDPAGVDGEQVRSRCGVVSAKPSLYDRLSGADNLRYAAELYGLGRGRSAELRIGEAAAMFDIDASLELQVGGYSTGMKTRLALARAILADPDLLLLDEPTSGLDPESAASVLELIRTMSSQGRTVLMCTHLLMEAEGLADNVVVMEHGTSLLNGEPGQLSKQYWPDPIVTLQTVGGAELRRLAGLSGVKSSSIVGSTATVHLDRADRIPDLVLALTQAGARITGVQAFQPTLEDLYFAVRQGTRSSNDRSVTEPTRSAQDEASSTPRSRPVPAAQKVLR